MRARALLYFWPGLPALWDYGACTGLVTAVLFSVLLNFALVVTFIWFETITPVARSCLWWTLAIAWAGFAVRGLRTTPRNSAAKMLGSLDLFCRAQGEYLRGNWVEAELQLVKLLDDNSADCDARLLLASLYRHTGRVDEALAQLRHLEQLDSAVKWRWEIEQERTLLRERQESTPEAATSAAEMPASLAEESPIERLAA
jgi:hypothetical protein